MQDLIKEITLAIQKYKNNFYIELEKPDTFWSKNYPITILHTIHRAKTQATKNQFKNLVNTNGITKEQYTKSEFEEIFLNAPEALQSVNYVALKNKINYKVNYKAKYPNDFWKKIKDVDHIQSTFDFIEFSDEADKCKIEFELREIIRKRKEVHALKEVGFIWMATTNNDATKVFKHYFGDNYVHVNNSYIGWSDKLKDINMRYFVCPPI